LKLIRGLGAGMVSSLFDWKGDICKT